METKSFPAAAVFKTIPVQHDPKRKIGAPRSVGGLNFKPKGEVMPSPRDWRDQFIYQLLIDRFDDNQEHPAYDPKTANHDRKDDERGKVQGGNIRGLIRRLDYLRNLGCTAIWLSPPFKNRLDDVYAHHGYAIQDFLAVDPRFGTTEDLKELVREAHQRGMYVILDIVINHTGNNWGYPDDAKPHPFNEGGQYEFGFWRKNGGEELPHDRVGELGPDDGVWPKELQNPDFFKRRGYIRDLMGASTTEAVDGDFFSLKDLNLGLPEVVDILIKIYKYWICECDVDGFRMDTIGNTEPEAAAIFTNAIREYAKRIGKHNFLIYAEVIGDDAKLQKYIGGNQPVQGTHERYPIFNACLDFPLYFILEEVIKGFRPLGELRERYQHFREFYRDYGEAGRYFVTFVDNHDQTARPFRRLMHNVDDWRQAGLAIGYVLCNMGIPCIYYGTEQGFDGGGSEDTMVRECMFGGRFGSFGTTGMQFFNPENPIYKQIAKIAEVRAGEPALRYGRQYFRDISGDGIHFGTPQNPGGMLAFSRVLDTEEVIVAMNLDAHDRDDRIAIDGRLSPPGCKMHDLLNGGEPREVQMTDEKVSFVHVPLKARSMAILKNCG